MGFLGVYTALYEYAPQSEGELEIAEGDILLVLERNTEDDWWKAKKRAGPDEDEEPVGLIPNNYIQEAQPIHQAKALYDYTRQTDEELSFAEDDSLSVYDTTDPDWTLVGLNDEFGFAPTNYIEMLKGDSDHPSQAPRSSTTPVSHQEAPELDDTPSTASSPAQTPAAALAGILAQKQSSAARSQTRDLSPPQSATLPPRRPTFTPDASDEDTPSPPAPSLPTRPDSQQYSTSTQYAKPQSPKASGVVASPPYNRASMRYPDDDDSVLPASGGFHLYNVNEVVSVMGKQKKMPTTLGINSAKGNIMIAPAKSRDGDQQEWTAEKLLHYSMEGKHVFMELVKPAKSVDFHAGAKDTAKEIVSALGEIAGAARAEGLREVIAAGSGQGQKKGQVLYDFVAQGDDEVTVAVDDEVIIIDDSKSDEWWMVRRLKNGTEGVVPSSFIEITGITSPSAPSTSGVNAGKSTVEQNRLEEERLAREASKGARSRDRAGSNPKGSEVGPGVKLPERGSSLMARDNGNGSSSQRKREGKTDPRSSGSSKPKPDASKTRTWTDRSGSFKVEAEFIGCREGKIHLHKLNGVKIAVPVSKMAVEDLEYVERATGLSLDEDKPLSDVRRQKQRSAGRGSKEDSSGSKVGASIEPKKDEYDWFDFFLRCGVGVHQCERYAMNFTRDSMDEAVLSDITASNLRTLGLKEGDTLRVMKYLDNKFGRTAANRSKRNVSFGGTEVMGNGEGDEDSANGGLFSGPGGALRNNTRKGRPAPAVQTNDVVDAKAFDQDKSKSGADSGARVSSPTKAPPPIAKDDAKGFDDDAWAVKPSKQPAATSPPAAAASPLAAPETQQTQPQPSLTGSMKDLSLLSAPLQPTVVHNTGSQQVNGPQQPQQIQQPQPPPQQQPQTTGVTPSFFNQLGPQATGAPMQQNPAPPAPPLPSFNPQQTGMGQQNNIARQRPPPPQMVQNQGSLMPPPPPRPLSAPQNASQLGAFGPPPLQPQLTGYQNSGAYQPQPGVQIAPPGQSLNDIGQMRQQQQQQPQQQLMPQMTGYNQQSNGFAPQPTGFLQQGMIPQPTGYNQQASQVPQAPQNNFQQPPAPQQFLNSQATGSPFANPGQPGPFQSLAPQPTGYVQPQATGLNSILPPALQPQQTGANGFGQGFTQSPPPLPPIPPIPSMPAAAPLQHQKTGPAPPVRFGVANNPKKLTPQATGRRANLSAATPENPFGF